MQNNKPVGTWFYKFAWVVLRIFSFIFYPSSILNRERLEREAPFIITANHQSMMDPPLIAIHSRKHQIHFLGKDTLRKNALVRWVLDHLHMIPVARNATDIGAMRACLAALKEGHVMGIFPEGTRKEAVMMEKMGSGIGLIALRSGLPVVPVLIADKPRMFRKTRLIVGEEIDYEDLKQAGVNKESCEELTRRIKEATYQLKDLAENK